MRVPAGAARPAAASDHRSVGPRDAALRRTAGESGRGERQSPSSIRTVRRERAPRGEHVILVREETTPEDFHGIVAARAVLTARGGMTSHAAVVARGMGKCAIVGCKDIHVDVEHRRFSVNGNDDRRRRLAHARRRDRPGLRRRPADDSERSGARHQRRARRHRAHRSTSRIAELLGWADEVRTLRVRANADTPRDARIARGFGAEGIGLCRTEHMFFEGDRITAMREMIVARDEGGRRRALAKLLPMQRADFEGIFEAMNGLPVTIRLLDPPLHEFLPHGGEEIEAARAHARTSRAPSSSAIVESLRETNPMLGHRGCRLGITYPEITEMQGRAIFEAAVRAMRRGIDVQPEIMIPLVVDGRRSSSTSARSSRTSPSRCWARWARTVPYLIGTMIELPRAALTADEIAQRAEFFSFGTNDLTQTTYGPQPRRCGPLPSVLHRAGYLRGRPIPGARHRRGRKTRSGWLSRTGGSVRPKLKIGICGEHGGEPRSVAFCHAMGLDYVSCSPFRVPIARLAAAHAALEAQGRSNARAAWS